MFKFNYFQVFDYILYSNLKFIYYGGGGPITFPFKPSSRKDMRSWALSNNIQVLLVLVISLQNKNQSNYIMIKRVKQNN